MLEVTKEAVAVLEKERQRAGAPPGSGVRIKSDNESGRRVVRLTFEADGHATDQTVEQAGLRVFISADLTDELAGSTLDVDATQSGLQLRLR